ncbi:MAG: histidine phosphatase family protein [Acidimicrobiales bacterium]|nr:histidine phosphatase family protein [Acidimicrobiales bacterium]
MTRLLLVRHGQSVWNADGRWQGQADPPLSPLGEAQARAAARSVGEVDAIVASDLRRARRTAELIAEGLGAGPVAVDVRLRERDAGEWTGCTRDDIELRWPGWLEAHRRPPGYEPDEHLLGRVLAAVLDAAAVHAGGSVLVVAHGGAIRTFEHAHGAELVFLPNLGAREVTVAGGTVALGPRRDLIDHDEVAAVFGGDQIE